MPGDDTVWRSKGRHRPPHLYVGGITHMVTAATVAHAPFLALAHRKDYLLKALQEACAAAGTEILAWVILDTHYHLVAVPQTPPPDVAAALVHLHRRSAAEFNREDGTPGRPVWHSHWDRRLFTEGDLYSRIINYIHRNPVKHGYVSDPGDWAWSSFRAFAALGNPRIVEGLRRFPAPRRLPGDD
ncbi:MAG: transposase [Armatimonadetes bacterium]|nr:transposase [Armatimonadota bacterium]